MKHHQPNLNIGIITAVLASITSFITFSALKNILILDTAGCIILVLSSVFHNALRNKPKRTNKFIPDRPGAYNPGASRQRMVSGRLFSDCVAVFVCFSAAKLAGEGGGNPTPTTRPPIHPPRSPTHPDPRNSPPGSDQLLVVQVTHVNVKQADDAESKR